MAGEGGGSRGSRGTAREIVGGVLFRGAVGGGFVVVVVGSSKGLKITDFFTAAGHMGEGFGLLTMSTAEAAGARRGRRMTVAERERYMVGWWFVGWFEGRLCVLERRRGFVKWPGLAWRSTGGVVRWVGYINFPMDL